jgi:tetrahydromethanopterin S-methyltransferase subunit G
MPRVATKNPLLTRRVRVVESTLDDVIFTTKQGFDEMDQRFDKTDRRINRVKHEVVMIGDALARQLTLMEAEFAANRHAHDRFEERFDQIDQRLDSMDQRMDSMDQKFEQRFNQVEQRFDRLDQKLGIS